MILYIENSKDSINKLLELISKFSKVIGCKFSKVIGYKISRQKSVVFLYTNYKLSEKLRKQSHLQLH